MLAWSRIGCALSLLLMPAIAEAQRDDGVRARSVQGQRDEKARVESLAGCYATAVGKFSPRPTGFSIERTRVPAQLQLEAHWSTSQFGAGNWRLHAIPRDARPYMSDGYFRPIGRDSVALDWSNGLVGLSIRVKERAKTFQGVVMAWTDDGEDFRAPITLRRITCAAV
jgi:hypothetical protein